MAKKRREAGQGLLRKRKDGRWEGRIVIDYDEKGLPITKTVTSKSKTECQAKMEKLKESLGKTNNKINSKMLFGEWLDYCYKVYSKPFIKPKTQEDYENRIYNHIIPEIGEISIEDLTQSDLQKFYARLKTSGRKNHIEKCGEGVSNRLVRGCHITCNSALEKAVQEGVIKQNPASGCKLPPKKSKEMKILTKEEMYRFLIQANEYGLYELFVLELSTGMRRGEILALQWNDLKFKTGELNISRQVYTVNGELIVDTPKTKSSIRTIVLPPEITEMLKEYKTKVDSIWIFHSPKDNAKPRWPSAVRNALSRILERAECNHVRFHDLRHTFSTMALEYGMDVKTLSTIIGHTSAHTTLDIYSHITDTMQLQAAARIDKGIGKNEDALEEIEKVSADSDKKPVFAKFEAKKGKHRKPGTGCVSKINDHLYEGRYSPRDANGKRISRNIYSKTREECEILLAEMIKEMKAEIQAEKERLKTEQSM